MRRRAVRAGRASIRTRRRAPAPREPGRRVTGGKAIAALRRAYRSQLLIIAAHDLAPAVESSLPTTALPAVCQALTDAGRRHPAGRAGRRGRRAAGRRARRPGSAVIAMGKMRRQGTELPLRRRRDLRRRPPGPDDDRRPDDGRMLATATQLASRLMRICGVGGLGGRRRAAARGQGRRAGPHPGRPGQLLPAVGAHLGVPGAAQGPAGGRRPGSGSGSSWTSPRPGCGRRPAGTRSSTTCRPCAAGSRTTSRSGSATGSSSSAPAGCGTSSSPSSCCSWCTAGPTPTCGCPAP